jgi:hypothetical protein
MNTLVIVLVAIIVWLAYTMYNSYRAMEKELREIRLKCIGQRESVYTSDPAETMKTTMLGILSKLAKVSS